MVTKQKLLDQENAYPVRHGELSPRLIDFIRRMLLWGFEISLQRYRVRIDWREPGKHVSRMIDQQMIEDAPYDAPLEFAASMIDECNALPDARANDQ